MARRTKRAPKRERASGSGNVLYFGDHLSVLREHVKGEAVGLVSMDPPFMSNQDSRTIQELVGCEDVSTTMICTHVPNRGHQGIRSPGAPLADT